MPDGDKNDLVSKCVAIQYGVFIAGIVLLVVVAFNWYSDYSNQCLATCKVAQQSCKAQCAPVAVIPQTTKTSKFADHPHTKAHFAPRSMNGKMNEKQLEHFLGSTAGHDEHFDTSPGASNPIAPDADDMMYDPAKESLEQSVFDSHQEFVEDSYTSTQGPNSSNVERDDDTGPVKRWGLRRIDYQSIYSGDDARTVSSEYPEQMDQNDTSIVL